MIVGHTWPTFDWRSLRAPKDNRGGPITPTREPDIVWEGRKFRPPAGTRVYDDLEMAASGLLVNSRDVNVSIASEPSWETAVGVDGISGFNVTRRPAAHADPNPRSEIEIFLNDVVWNSLGRVLPYLGFVAAVYLIVRICVPQVVVSQPTP